MCSGDVLSLLDLCVSEGVEGADEVLWAWIVRSFAIEVSDEAESCVE